MAIITSLQIETGLRGGKTFLKKGYAEHPFKIATINTDPSCPNLELMLMSSSPGILDGDHYQIKILAGPDTSLQVKTQSYQRLFSMKQGASQQMHVQLQAGADFTYLPHPVSPHAGSLFFSKNNIYLSERCRLIWGEVITPGRKMNGEEFMFTRYQNLTEIFRNNKLLIRENLLLEPLNMHLHSIGQLQGYTHQATMICLDEKRRWTETIPAVHEWLNAQEYTCCGVSATPGNGIIIRMLGYKAEQLFDCIHFIHAHFLQKELNVQEV